MEQIVSNTGIVELCLVMKRQDFECEGKVNGLRVYHGRIDAGKMVGFLPVYASYEDAVADYPGTKILLIEEVSHREV